MKKNATQVSSSAAVSGGGHAYTSTPAIVIEKPRQVSFREIQLPELQPGGVIAETTMSAVSSGTDMKTWRGQQHPEQLHYPLVPGYENVGRIVHVDGNETDYKIGDRVMINEAFYFPELCSAWGGGVKYSVKDSRTCPAPDGIPAPAFNQPTRIPDGVSDEQAVMAYLAAVSLKGVERVPCIAGDYVLVIGAGLIGLAAMQLVKILHPEIKTICLEKREFRQHLAKELVDHVVAADGHEEAKIREITEGRMADKVIECSGNAAVVAGLHRFLKGGPPRCPEDTPAHIHLQGDYPEQIVLHPYHKWFTKNCTITMSCANTPAGKERILNWMAGGEFRTDIIPIEIWPADKCAEAYEYFDKHEETVLKILFK